MLRVVRLNYFVIFIAKSKVLGGLIACHFGLFIHLPARELSGLGALKQALQ
jgi:hypothetical protein